MRDLGSIFGGFNVMMILGILLGYLFWVAICGSILRSKGYKPTNGAEYGWGFLGIIGVIICACKEDAASKQLIQQTLSNATRKDPADQLLKYKSLLDQGVINQEEFNTYKRQLLGNASPQTFSHTPPRPSYDFSKVKSEDTHVGWYCLKCGEPNPSSTRTCRSCGHQQ